MELVGERFKVLIFSVLSGMYPYATTVGYRLNVVDSCRNIVKYFILNIELTFDHIQSKLTSLDKGE